MQEAAESLKVNLGGCCLESLGRGGENAAGFAEHGSASGGAPPSLEQRMLDTVAFPLD